MHIFTRFRRAGLLLAGLGAALVTAAMAAPAALASVPPVGGGRGQMVSPPPGGGTFVPQAQHVVRTVVVGGTPGWQIALIAVGAALVAGALAVLADRAARRRPAVRPA